MHRARRAQRRLHGLARAQHHGGEAHGRQAGIAGFRVDVVELDRLRARRVLGKRAQARHGVHPRIAHHRIGRGRVAVAPRRHHAGRRVLDLRGVGTIFRRLQLALDRVGGFEIDEQRQVERIEPDHRAFAVMAMVVPRAAGREDQVAAFHHAFLAIHDGVGAFALDHDARRARRVAMGRGLLAGEQKLHAAEDRARDAHRAGPAAGIGEDQHAPLGFLHRGQFAGAQAAAGGFCRRPIGRPCSAGSACHAAALCASAARAAWCWRLRLRPDSRTAVLPWCRGSWSWVPRLNWGPGGHRWADSKACGRRVPAAFPPRPAVRTRTAASASRGASR